MSSIIIFSFRLSSFLELSAKSFVFFEFQLTSRWATPDIIKIYCFYILVQRSKRRSRELQQYSGEKTIVMNAKENLINFKWKSSRRLLKTRNIAKGQFVPGAEAMEAKRPLWATEADNVAWKTDEHGNIKHSPRKSSRRAKDEISCSRSL